MQFPSQVTYPTRPPRRLVHCAAGLSGAVAVGSAAFLPLPPEGMAAIIIGLLFTLLVIQHRFLRRQLPGSLLLTQGQAFWRDSSAVGQHVPGRLEMVLDVQRYMLLCFQPCGVSTHAHWLWLSRQDASERWHLLRCAVYSRAAAPRSAAPAVAPDRSMASE